MISDSPIIITAVSEGLTPWILYASHALLLCNLKMWQNVVQVNPHSNKCVPKVDQVQNQLLLRLRANICC